MPKIEKMFAFIAEDKDPDDEGLVGVNLNGHWFPLVGADMARINSLWPIVNEIAKTTGKTIKLIHFTNRVDIGEVEI